MPYKNYRTKGPGSLFSQAAADKLEKSGTKQAQKDAILSSVRMFSGRTSAEIAQQLNYERHVTASRLPELRDDGLVRNGPPRVCVVCNKSCLTWEPVEGPR